MGTEPTLAEEIGLTREEARAVAQVACDAAEAGDLQGSRAVLESLVALNPRDRAVQAALGMVYQKLDLSREAEVAYTAAITGGEHRMARLNRAELRLKRGDLRGLDDLESLVESAPHVLDPPALRAKMLLDTRRAARRMAR